MSSLHNMTRLSRTSMECVVRMRKSPCSAATVGQTIACKPNYLHLACMHTRIINKRSFSSVSASEVSKFSRFSETWWDPRQNPLVGMNSVRVEYIVGQLCEHKSQEPLMNLKVLDIGCGGGLLSESLARLGATVTAIDPSEELVKQAKRHSRLDPKTRSIDYKGGWAVEDLAHEFDARFDAIFLLEVIEHVTDPHSILSAAKSLLKPNGRLFISTLNRTAKSKLVAVIGAEYVMRYLPVGTHDWNQFRSPQEVNELVEENGLEQVNVNGMVLTSPPMWGEWDWRLDSKDTEINWIGTYKVASKTASTTTD